MTDKRKSLDEKVQDANLRVQRAVVQYNKSMVGGLVTGGAPDLKRLFAAVFELRDASEDWLHVNHEWVMENQDVR